MQEHDLRRVDLASGQVPRTIDVMVVIAPQGMTGKHRFTIDQYLMRGGVVVVAAGKYGLQTDPTNGSLGLKHLEDTLQDMLAHYGVDVEQSLVRDPQNGYFAVEARRGVRGTPTTEIQPMGYPFFVNIRQDGMASDSPIVANLPAVTLHWASPITTDRKGSAKKKVTELLRSSPESWTQTETNVQPDFATYPQLGFPTGSQPGRHTLAVSVQGSFDSFFKNKPSPLPEEISAEEQVAESSATPTLPPRTPPTIDLSPKTSRLVVIGSAEFLDDPVFDLSALLEQDRYTNGLQLLQNCIAWSTS